MVSTFTTNGHIELQGTGDNSGTWGSVLNTNALTIIDSMLGGAQTLSLSSTDVTVTTNQTQNNAVLLTGTLTANVAVIFPAIGRTFFIVNSTTGAFTVTIKSGTGSSVQVITQGASGFYVLNVNDVYLPTQPGVPTGAVQAFAMSTPPTGWLECDGTTISRSTYASLFGLIGTTFGSGDGSTTFNLPELRDEFIRGWDHGRGLDPGRVFGSSQISQNLLHTHGFTGNPLPLHHHTVDAGDQDAGGGIAADGQHLNYAFNTSGVSAGTPTGTNANSGGTEARPINVALLICVKAT